jgi:hypothetical protein
VDRTEQIKDRRTTAVALPSHGTAGRLAAASTGVAGRLAAAVAGVASWFRTTVTSTAGRLAAAFASTAIGLIAAAIAAAVVLPLALFEQALQPAEEVVLLPATAAGIRTAARLAAAVSGVTSGLRTTVASTTSRLAAAVAGVAAGLTASIAGIAAGLTARGTALVAEHPVEELKPKRLATNGDTKNQRTEEHHTLHRATSPLLVNHLRVLIPIASFGRPEVFVIHELFCGRPVEPFRDSKHFRLLPPPGCPTGTVIAPGDKRGYRRICESGLSASKYFSAHDLRLRVG